MSTKEHAQELLRESIVLDVIHPWSLSLGNWKEVLQKFRKGGFNSVLLTVSARGGISETMKFIAAQEPRWRSVSDQIILIRNVEDFQRALDEKKLGVGYMFQGTDCLESDPNMIEIYYKLGVRSIQLAYNIANPIADGCAEKRDAGLSNLGFEFIKEMNRVGMVIDCCHTGIQSTFDAVEASKDPVVVTHSNSRAVYDIYRNITDEQALAIAKSGGVIGVVGCGPYVSKHNDPTAERILQHLHHYVELIGIEHVGIGLDYVEDVDMLMSLVRANPHLFPEDISEPDRYYNVQEFHKIVEGMIDHGYSDKEIKGILGENFVRVFQKVWK